jgi:hypothetical protein
MHLYSPDCPLLASRNEVADVSKKILFFRGAGFVARELQTIETVGF